MTRPYPTALRPLLRTLPGLVITVLALLPLLVSCDVICERLQPARAAGQPRDTG